MERNNGINQLPDSRGKLLRLVDKNLMKKFLEAFTKTTGLTANIVDVEGRSIFSKKDAQKNCKFCKKIWQLEKKRGIRRCDGAYARAGRQSVLYDEPYIFRCPAGLIEWAAPIIIDKEHLGTIICGQVLMWEPEEFFWIELRAMNAGITDDFEALINAAKKLQVVSGEKVQNAAMLLSLIANLIIKTGWENLRRHNEFEVQKSMLFEEIQTRKNLEEKLNSQSTNFYREKEKTLMGCIKVGDYETCSKIFTVMLADIFSENLHDRDLIRSRVYELIVLVSRTSLDHQIDEKKAMGVNSIAMRRMYLSSDLEDIKRTAMDVLKFYLDEIQKNGGYVKNRSVIEGIKGYIRKNYNKDISLESIAASVCLSSFYASRLFKEYQKQTIMEYLTEVKLEEAKRLLGNPRYNVEEIALSVGYNDSSYFTKVFKKNEGMTPTQFRQSR